MSAAGTTNTVTESATALVQDCQTKGPRVGPMSKRKRLRRAQKAARRHNR